MAKQIKERQSSEMKEEAASQQHHGSIIHQRYRHLRQRKY